jgi:hypothetical protein
MAKPLKDPSVKIELISASPEQQPILANLLELYAQDFSEFHPIELGKDGRFGYSDLPLYWSESTRYPFLVTIDDKFAGFTFVRKGSRLSGDQNVWDMTEFLFFANTADVEREPELHTKHGGDFQDGGKFA